MRITTWAEYGLIVAVHLARQSGERPVPAREIAEHEGLPPDYVEQILLKLRRAGLVTSVRGARGGYFLARPASEVSVRDVLEAAENRTFEVNCDAYPIGNQRCNADSGCSIRPVWRALQRRVDDFLQAVTLEVLLASEEDVEEMFTGQGATAPRF